MTSVNRAPNLGEMRSTPDHGMVDNRAFTTFAQRALRLDKPALPAVSSSPVPRDDVGNPVVFRPTAMGDMKVIKTGDGRLLEPITVRTIETADPKNPDNVTTRKLYSGSFEAMPSPLRDGMVKLQISGNDIPDYHFASEAKVANRFAAPGKTMYAMTEVLKDGSETLLGVGALTAGHGVTKDGEAQEISYLQHLVGSKGSGIQIAKAAFSDANDRGTHLLFDSYDPRNELPGAPYSQQRFAPDFATATTIYDPRTMFAAEDQISAEMRQAQGLPADAKVDAGICPVIGITPFDKAMGHDNDAIRAALFPEMAGKTLAELTPEQRAQWAAASNAFGHTINEDGTRTPKYHSDGTQHGLTPLLAWDGTLRRDRAGELITSNHPTGTEMQMGKFTENGPRTADGDVIIPSHYYTSRGISNSYPTTSLEMGQFGHTGRAPSEPEPPMSFAKPERSPQPYRYKAGADGMEALDPAHRSLSQRAGDLVQGGRDTLQAGRQKIDDGLTAIGAKVDQGKAQVAGAFDTHVWTPLARTEAGRAALELGASAQVARVAATQTAPTRATDGPYNAVLPLYPGTSAFKATSPALTDTTTTLKTQNGLHFAAGTPGGVPQEYWAGAPGMAFGEPLLVDYTLRPALANTINTASGMAKTAANAVTGAGLATLAAGMATGSLQFGHFVSDSPTRTAQEKAIDRIVNLPKGTEMAYASAQVPFTPKEWNLASTAFAGVKHQPFYYKAAFLPGQKGVSPWTDVMDNRLKVVFQNTAGQNIAFGGLLTGNENLYVNRMLIANVPRAAAPMATLDVLPNAQRGAAVDGSVGMMAAPVGVFALTDYGVYGTRVTEGKMISPAAVRVLVGTEGFKGSKLSVGRPDVIDFKAVSPNPSYRADDPILKSAQNSATAIREFFTGKPTTPGQ